MHAALIQLLHKKHPITNVAIAIKHADLLIPIAREFVRDITTILTPEEYEGASHEFIEMVISIQTYVTAHLFHALYDMFPVLSLEDIKAHFAISLKSAIELQMPDID